MSGGEALLLRVFPRQALDSLKRNEPVQPVAYSNMSILFADIEGYTALASNLSAIETHNFLHSFYTVVDNLLSCFEKLTKIETIGDAIMLATMKPDAAEERDNGLEDLVRFAMLISVVIPRVLENPTTGESVTLRIGIHTGEVVGGVMGSLMPRYTLSGDTINVAARMQQICPSKSILLSAVTAARYVRDHGTDEQYVSVQHASQHGMDSGLQIVCASGVRFTSFGLQEVKGKGQCQCFTIDFHEAATTASVAIHHGGTIRERLDLTLKDSDLQVFFGSFWEVLSHRVPLPATETPGGYMGPFLTNLMRAVSSEGGDSTGLSLPNKFNVSGSLTRSSALRCMSVLIGDDSAKVCAKLSHKLKALNPTILVKATNNSQELRNELVSSAFAYDLVLVNIALEERRDGVALVKGLLSQYPTQMHRIITVVFGSDCKENELAVISVAADAFLAYPVPECPQVLMSFLVQLALAKIHSLLQRRALFTTDTAVRLQSAQPCEFLGPDCATLVGEDGICVDGGVPFQTAFEEDYLEASNHSKSPTAITTTTAAFPSEPNLDGDASSLSRVLKIIVVEDSTAQRKLLLRQLQKCEPLRWHVVGVQDGTECLAYLRANNCEADVVFVDMNLGESMTGTELVLQIRNALGMTRALIVGLNRAREEIEKEFCACGADASWGKPLPPVEIIRSRLASLMISRSMLVSLQDATLHDHKGVK